MTKFTLGAKGKPDTTAVPNPANTYCKQLNNPIALEPALPK